MIAVQVAQTDGVQLVDVDAVALHGEQRRRTAVEQQRLAGGCYEIAGMTTSAIVERITGAQKADGHTHRKILVVIWPAAL